jgi:hypothetical protein
MEGEAFVINLGEFADESIIAGYRNKKDGGAVLPQTLLNVHSDTQVKGKLMHAVHGTLTPKGRPATLLIFEFDLTAQDAARFKKATVRVIFEDSEGQPEDGPEIHKYSPKGLFAVNRETETSDVSHAVDAGASAAPVPALSFNLGYHWTLSNTKKKTHAARLNGTTDSTRRDGEETIVLWNINEDPTTKEIPTFLRTAVVLRHNPYDPGQGSRKFNVTIEFEGLVGKSGWISGSSQLHEKMHEPMELSPDVFPEEAARELGLEKLTANLGGLELDSQYMVRVAQILNV